MLADALESFVTDDNESGRLAVSLTEISKLMRALTGLRMAEIGLSVGEDELLATLTVGMPTPATWLAGRMSVRAGSVQKMTERLAARGLVSIAAGGAVELSDAGAEVVSKLSAIRKQIAQDVSGRLRLDQLEAVNSAADLVHANLKAIVSNS